MNINPIKEVTPEIVNAIKNLITILAEPRCEITAQSLNKLIEDEESELIVAKDEHNNIVGFLCLIIYTIPSTKKAFIEDVVVSESVRGQGYGKALVSKAIDLAQIKGAKYVDLSSNSKRIAANALYQKMGFIKRDTNYYRLLF